MVADLGVRCSGGEHRAGLHRLPVEMDDTGPALAGLAATWVPVSRSVSRRKSTRSVLSGTSARTSAPFTFIATSAIADSPPDLRAGDPSPARAERNPRSGRGGDGERTTSATPAARSRARSAASARPSNSRSTRSGRGASSRAASARAAKTACPVPRHRPVRHRDRREGRSRLPPAAASASGSVTLDRIGRRDLRHQKEEHQQQERDVDHRHGMPRSRRTGGARNENPLNGAIARPVKPPRAKGRSRRRHHPCPPPRRGAISTGSARSVTSRSSASGRSAHRDRPR